jgi:hypothetical protein
LLLKDLPILTILSGVFFVLAGLFAFFGVSVYYLAPIIFVAAGGGVILLALWHQKPTRGSIALFILSLIVLASVGGGYGAKQTTTTFAAPRAKVPAQVFDLRVSTDFGSINILLTNRTDIAYRVNFTRSFFNFNFFGGPAAQLSNSTTGATFTLNVHSSSSKIDLILGRGYTTNITASTSAGSIDLTVPSGLILAKLDLSAGTGSIDTSIGATTVGSIRLETSTGSVDLSTQKTIPSGRLVPVTLSTSTGSVSLNMGLPNGVAASLKASTGTGSLTRDLTGFSISQDTRGSLQAVAGDPGGASQSFAITASAGTGSVDLVAVA